MVRRAIEAGREDSEAGQAMKARKVHKNGTAASLNRLLMTTTAPRYAHPATFAFIVAVVYAAALPIAVRLSSAAQSGAIAVGLTLDLVVLVPLAYHVILVRGRGWPAVTTAVVFLVSLYAAHFVVPAAHHAPLTLLAYVAVPVEVSLIGYVLFKAVRTVRSVGLRRSDPNDTDLLEHLRRTMRQAFDVRVLADVIAYELAVFYYALFSWRSPTPSARFEASTYTYHKTSGYGVILAGIMIALIVELVGVHILLHLWSPTVAWIHTALGLYGLLWLVGDYRAMRFRPIHLHDDAVHLRCGLRWSIRVPLASIASVEEARRHHADERGYLSVAASPSPQLVIQLNRPVLAEGPYGIRKSVRVLGIGADEPAQLQDALRQRCA